jgi:hypothetical protein
MSCVADLSTNKSGAFGFMAKGGENTRPPLPSVYRRQESDHQQGFVRQESDIAVGTSQVAKPMMAVPLWHQNSDAARVTLSALLRAQSACRTRSECYKRANTLLEGTHAQISLSRRRCLGWLWR